MVLAFHKTKQKRTKWHDIALVQELKESKDQALAEQGDAKAQFDYGMTYLSIATSPKDYAEAIEWIRKAAEQGNGDAQHELGVIYEIAQGVPQDSRRSSQMVSQGCRARRCRLAECNLGMMYSDGDGVPQDYVEAYKWYNLAAAQGDTDAIKNRDIIVADSMTPEQIAEAQQLSRDLFREKKLGQF